MCAPSGQTRYGARTTRTRPGASPERLTTSRRSESMMWAGSSIGCLLIDRHRPGVGVIPGAPLEVRRYEPRRETVDDRHRKDIDRSGDDEHRQIAARQLLDPARS